MTPHQAARNLVRHYSEEITKMLETEGRASNDLFTNYVDGYENLTAECLLQVSSRDARQVCKELEAYTSVRLTDSSPDYIWFSLALQVFSSALVNEWAELIKQINYAHSNGWTAKQAIEEWLK